MIPPLLRQADLSRYKRSSKMTFTPDLEAFFRTEETSRAQADIFDELAERGKSDETGSELSDEDWADSQ